MQAKECIKKYKKARELTMIFSLLDEAVYLSGTANGLSMDLQIS
uniref:Uncharacterized protein n=1 Tax=Arundo donax TaxID=35708 RepID=A0A0A9DKN2_ARUDO